MTFKLTSSPLAALSCSQCCTRIRSALPLPTSLLNRKRLVALVLIIFIIIVFSLRSQNDDDDDDSDIDYDPSPGNMSSIVIFTRYRSGSSFVGELFNHHPKVFYIFEPFKLFPEGRKWNSYIRSQASTYLSELGHCNFHNIVNDSMTLPDEDRKSIRHWFSRSLCPKTHSQSDMSKCAVTSLGSIERDCRRHSHVVSKVIRVYDVTALVPYFQQDQKVIHLIRDPRGIISSRMKIEQVKMGKSDQQYFKDIGLRIRETRIAASKACIDIRENLRIIHNLVNEVPEFHKLYKIVRYEDIALDPLLQADALFRYTGLEFHDNVREWLASATSGVNTTQQQGALKYAYSTSRKSSYLTATAWRKHLPFQIVKAVQNMCRNELKSLGYVAVNDIIQLTDETFEIFTNFSAP